MAFGGRKREFLDFLAQQGLINAPAPVPPPPVMPMDIARGHNLPTNNANIIAQMYGDTRPPAPAPFVPPAVAQDLFQNAPMQTFAPPGALPNERAAETLATQFRIANDPALAESMAARDPFLSWNRIESIARGAAEVPGAIQDSLLNPTESPIIDPAKQAGEIATDIYEYPLDTRKDAAGETMYKYATGEYTGPLSGDNLINFQRIWALDPRTHGMPMGFNPETALPTDADKETVKQIYEAAEAEGKDGGRAVWEWYINQFPQWQRATTEALGDPANWTIAATPVGELAIAKAATTEGRVAPVVLKTVGQLLKAPEMVADAPFEVPAAIVRGAKWGGRRAAAKAAEEAATGGGNILTRSSAAQVARDAEEEVLRQATIAKGLYEDPDYVNRAEALASNQAAELEAQAIARVADKGYVLPNGQNRLIPGETGPVPNPVTAVSTTPVSAVPTQPLSTIPEAPPVGTTPINERPIDTVADQVDAATTPGISVGQTTVETPEPTVVNSAIWTGPVRPVEQLITVDPFTMSIDELRIMDREYRDVGLGNTPDGQFKWGVEKALRSRVSESPSTVSSTLQAQPDSTLPTLDRVVNDQGENVQFYFNPKPEGSKSVDILAREEPHVYPKVVDDMGEWVETKYQPTRNLLRTDTNLTPEQQALKAEIPGAEPYMPPPEGKMTREYTDYRGTNKALSQVYDAEAYGRLRLSTHLNGGDVDKLVHTMPEALNNNLAGDAKLAKLLGIPYEKTFKGLTKESAAARFMLETDPTIEQGLLNHLVNNKFFRTDPGVTEAEQRAYARYTQAINTKPWVIGDKQALDNILSEQGLSKAPIQTNPVDVERMPATQDIIARGDTWTADRLDTVNRLPEEVKAPIYAEVSPWADYAYENIAITSPRQKVFTDLEFAARLREAAVKQGITLQTPQSIPYSPDNLESLFRAAVQEPDAAKSDAIIEGLRKSGHVAYEKPNPYGYALTPGQWHDQINAFDNYARILDLRKRLHSSAAELTEEMARRTAPVLGPPVPVVKPTKVQTQIVKPKKYDELVKREMERIKLEWAQDPDKGVPTQFDNLLAVAVEDGRITDAEAIALRQPKLINFGTKTEPKIRRVTVGDLFIENLGKSKNKRVEDAVRETNSMIAKADLDAIKAESKIADEDIAASVKQTLTDYRKSEAMKQNRTKAGTAGKLTLQTYDGITRLWRDMYLYNPASVVRNGFVDALSNSFIQMLEGHALSGFKSLPFVSPRTHWAMYKHNMRGQDIVHDAIIAAGNWDVQPGAGVIDVVTREFQDASSTIYSPIPVLGKIMDTGQGLRHTSDQTNRANLWGDQFGREIKIALHGQPDSVWNNTVGSEGFYNHVIGVMGGGAKADEAVAKLRQLENMGGFKPSDVREHTGSVQLSKDWREMSRQAGKNADKEVNRIFYSYRQTNLDAATRRVFMFHYWMSRALVQHTRLALSNPLLLYRYTQMWEAFDREAQRQGIDGPLAPLQMYAEFMKGDGGMYGISNPIGIATPYSMFSELFTSQGGDQTTWDKTIGKVAFALPQVQMGLVVTGLSTRYPDFFGTSAVRRMVRNVLDWDRNSGYNVFYDDPGVTGDPFQHWTNIVLERANQELANRSDEINDVELPNLNKPAQDTVANLIIENAEDDFGVPYKDMTPVQKREVNDAINAAREGSGSNERANEAFAQYGTGAGWSAAFNWWLPGGMRARSEYQNANQMVLDEYYDTGVKTPESENAFAAQEAINYGSPEAGSLDLDKQVLDAVGSEAENIVYDGYNDIAYAYDLDPMGYVEIAGKFYWGYEMNKMTPDQRKKLAQAYLLDNGYSQAWLDGFKGRRDQVVANSDSLPDYKQYQKEVGDYEGGATYSYDNPRQMPTWTGGGVRAMRQDMEIANPNFGRAIAEERAKQEEKGLYGEKLEQALDMWTMGPEGYMAYSGIKADARDPNPIALQDTSKVPPPLGGSSGSESYGGTSGTSGSGTEEEKRETPPWHVDLRAEVSAYEQAIKDFEAEYGSINNFQFHPEVLDRHLPEMSRNMKEYVNWSQEETKAGRDGSIDAYLKMKDDEYYAKKEQKAKEESGEGKTVQQLLAEVEAVAAP